jgi:hypothetical protein
LRVTLLLPTQPGSIRDLAAVSALAHARIGGRSPAPLLDSPVDCEGTGIEPGPAIRLSATRAPKSAGVPAVGRSAGEK